METTPQSRLTIRELGFIETDEAAALCDAKPLTLANWRAAGKGPPYTKIHGNKIVYPLDGLKKWLTSKTVHAGGPGSLSNPRKLRRRGT